MSQGAHGREQVREWQLVCPRLPPDHGMTDETDIAIVAGQLADLTRTVEQMATQLQAVVVRADTQQAHTETQQERIDLAARELAEVSERLQAAANALRESI